MEFIKQQDGRGCSIACVAMLAEVSYEAVLEELTSHFPESKILNASFEFWLTYLEDRFGFDCSQDHWEIPDLDELKEIPKGKRYLCAHGLASSDPERPDFNTHAFVLDEHGIVFDPAEERPGALPLEEYRQPPKRLLIVASVVKLANANGSETSDSALSS